MPKLQVITRERHADLRWQRVTNHASAAADTVAPLVISELPTAAMSLPLAFIAQGEAYVPTAVLGLQPGNNLFVSPEGAWQVAYLPALYRSLPFRFLAAEDGQQVLCIDEEIGLADEAVGGEDFFTPDGQPAQAVREVFNFLSEVEKSRRITAVACAALQKHGLIRPWPFAIKTSAGELSLSGLFQIDEAALNRLSDEAFLEVRKAGGLPLAYCQLLSMQHLPTLGRLFEERVSAHRLAPQQVLLSDELKDSFYGNNGTISFANL